MLPIADYMYCLFVDPNESPVGHICSSGSRIEMGAGVKVQNV